jgi:hypothetical protein
MAKPDGLVPIGSNLTDELFVHHGPGTAPGPDLVNHHAHHPGSYTAKKGLIFNDHGMSSSTGRSQGGTYAGRSSPDNKNIHTFQDFVFSYY